MIRSILLCFAVFIFQAQNVFAQEKTIQWYYANFPPGFIESGPMKEDGYENYLEKLLRERLDDYSHTYQTANYERILEEIRSGNACCVALLRKEEREKYVEYSLPTMVALANGLFIKPQRIDEFKPYIDAEGYISINKLFYQSEMRMGISKGRRYNGTVDEIIKEVASVLRTTERRF